MPHHEGKILLPSELEQIIGLFGCVREGLLDQSVSARFERRRGDFSVGAGGSRHDHGLYAVVVQRIFESSPGGDARVPGCGCRTRRFVGFHDTHELGGGRRGNVSSQVCSPVAIADEGEADRVDVARGWVRGAHEESTMVNRSAGRRRISLGALGS